MFKFEMTVHSAATPRIAKLVGEEKRVSPLLSLSSAVNVENLKGRGREDGTLPRSRRVSTFSHLPEFNVGNVASISFLFFQIFLSTSGYINLQSKISNIYISFCFAFFCKPFSLILHLYIIDMYIV